MIALRRSLLRGATLVAAACMCLPAPARAQERDTTSILEEQELLRRQLQRLKRTMEALLPRLEQEGRPRALELLRDGLTLLETRGDGTGQLTIEELMERARLDVQTGQVASSLERQEQITHPRSLVGHSLHDMRHAQFPGTQLHALRLPTGQDGGADAGLLTHSDAQTIAGIESLHLLAAVRQVDRAIRHHAVHVEDGNPDPPRLRLQRIA